jgi:cell pole-organizing protein PopZ
LEKEKEAMSAANSIQTSGDLSDTEARVASNEAMREPLREPSMEEILASIRRIIAQDQSLFAAETPTGGNIEQARGAEPEAVDQAEAPIYGLRYEVEAETLATHPEAIGAEEPLVSPATDASVATAFNTLVASRFAQDPKAVLAMTRDALRPLLASWLDAHLPALVERLVVAEIERIAKNA